MSAATDTEAIFMNVFEGLVRFDEAGSIIPGLAESWDISNDSLDLYLSFKKECNIS